MAVGIRAVWLVLLPVPPESDFATFLAMAEAIAGGSWQPDSYGWVYQGFGYPVLLAPILALGGSVPVLGLANLVLQLAMVVVIGVLAFRLFGGRSAALAATLVAIMPGVWSYVPLLAAESLGMLLLAAVALLLVLPPTRWQAVLTGVLVMALALARPSFMPFVMVVLIAVFLRGTSSRPRQLAAFAGGALLILLPVVALNLSNDGPALPIGAAGWQTWLVNNEHATGAWFNATADDAYPFHGLVGDSEIREAQSKLGRQFVAANPVEALKGLVTRHELNWQSDVMGISWSLDRAPSDWQSRVPLHESLDEVAQLIYVVVLGMAFVGAIRQRDRLALYVPVVLPLLFGVALLAVAEGNARYHAIYLPLLCVLAGGAIAKGASSVEPSHISHVIGFRLPAKLGSMGIARIVVLLAGIGAIILYWAQMNRETEGWVELWERARFDLPPLLVAGAVLVPTISALVLLVRRSWPGWLRRLSVPSWPVRTATALSLLIVVVGGVAVIATALEWRSQVAAVSPDGWNRTVTSGDEEVAAPLILEHSGTSPEVQQVSFPDAALLQFDDEPEAGDRVELTRRLDRLEPGETYVFYLQVYDPGIVGDQSERLLITLNGSTVWERLPGRNVLPRWHYVRVEWQADGEELDISVSREAGDRYRATYDAIPKVRTLHLYPLY